MTWREGPQASQIMTSPKRRAALPMLQTSAFSFDQNTMTPPETPSAIYATSGSAPASEPLFNNYLRAFHHFDPAAEPSAEQDDASITVPIKSGDLILVHSVHANGWADGTVLTTGGRGWVPTNYCEPYDHPRVRNLLNAMTQFWDLLEDSEEASFSAFVRQDYIRGLIAGVRYLLEQMNCLHRDAALVQQNVGIRRMRKGLLADLASMVQKSRELQEEASQPYAGEVVHIVLDELVAKAFKVVTRAVRFVDIWSQEADSNHMSHTRHGSGVIAAPGTHTEAEAEVSEQEHGSIVPTAANSTGSSFPEGRRVSTRTADVAKRISVGKRQSVGQASRGDMVSHRVSLIRGEHRSGTTASEQLSQAHDLCIGHIGKFLGHHLQSRSPSELMATTDSLVIACNALLAVTNQVPQQSSNGVPGQETRTVLGNVLAELVQSTKEVFTSSDMPEDEVIILPDQASRWISIGTRLIRAIGDCVTQTRTLLEQVGDFELDKPPFKSPDSRDAHQSSPPASRAGSVTKPESGDENRLSRKMLPPPPPVKNSLATPASAKMDFGMPSPAVTVSTDSPMSTSFTTAAKALPPPPSDMNTPQESPVHSASSRNSFTFKVDSSATGRKDSVSISMTDSNSIDASQNRDSEMSVVSKTSTRATTPERRTGHTERKDLDPKLLNSFGSVSSMLSTASTDTNELDSALLQKSYAHELILNHQGQVIGGTLQALVEQLTTHDSTPDPHFATTFYLTFRLFTTPRRLAQALIERFDYIGDSAKVGKPVRLRICQFFKGWLETNWNADADKDALGDVRFFALHKVKPCLPSASDRLLELTKRVTAAYHAGTAAVPLVSGLGKTSTYMSTSVEADSAIPAPTVSKGQLNALRRGLENPAECSILDIDTIEIARQLTLLASKTYCEIQPDELLRLEWTKKTSNKSLNVRNVSRLNTDLAYVVSDTILSPTEAKKRALVIRHWVRVAAHCHELNNFESVMAIVASMDSSVVQRLKRTWELVHKKTNATFTELKAVIDISQNYASLRRCVDNANAPCLPFLGIYLTDLTFIDAGNPSTRQIPGTTSSSGQAISVINFDKYARMAKIVAQIQRFQIPYRFHVVPELQTWLESYLRRMHEETDEIGRVFHRRSLVLEPRQPPLGQLRPAKTMLEPKVSEFLGMDGSGEKQRAETDRAEGVGRDHSRIDLFWKNGTFGRRAGLGLKAGAEKEAQREGNNRQASSAF